MTPHVQRILQQYQSDDPIPRWGHGWARFSHLSELRAPFDGFVEKAVRATTTCLITADHNRYSVDARAAGRMVLVRSHADRIRQ
jgi:hypothetical protein